jgi:RNA polymerase sigma-70 factor (ECF subfamily)
LCEQHIEDTIIHEQTMNDMLKLVDLLPQNQQDIVRMRFYENMSFKEIAESNQISINTALGRMRYAILNLRKYAAERNLLIDFEKIT